MYLLEIESIQTDTSYSCSQLDEAAHLEQSEVNDLNEGLEGLSPEHKQQKNNITTQIKGAALNYLARREYSRLELYQKLVAKGYQSSDIQDVLEYLQLQSYQSDKRFADMYIRSRINAGDGPFKIKISLRAKGICDSLALAVFDKLDIDWFDHAKAVKFKRFGEAISEDITEKVKQVRYLKNKGFYQDHINAVIDDTNH